MDAEEHEKVSRFLFDHVETHEQLAVLLLLHRAKGQPKTAEAVSTELGILTPLALSALEHLCEHGLAAAADHGFHYGPTDPSLELEVERLVRAYEQDWLPIMQLLSTNAVHRIRTSAITRFSDAFILKGKK